MTEILPPIEYVAKNSKHVFINSDKIKEFAAGFTNEHIAHWLSAAPFNVSQLSDTDKLNFLLVFNSISFCYWGNPKWTVEFNGKKADGAWGMITALQRAIVEGKPILDTKYRASLSYEEFKAILRANTDIPLLQERFNICKEIATTLLAKFDGDFANLVQNSEGDALKLLDLIVSEFPSFSDISEYKSKKIYFYKRAQLLVADIYQMFGGLGYGKLTNFDKLTACADYKLPQVLRRLGIFQYSEQLANKIDNKVEIPHDSEEEIEIRANTIWAVELIKTKLKLRIPDISSIHINDHLWLASQTKLENDKPYHLTKTIYY